MTEFVGGRQERNAVDQLREVSESVSLLTPEGVHVELSVKEFGGKLRVDTAPDGSQRSISLYKDSFSYSLVRAEISDLGDKVKKTITSRSELPNAIRLRIRTEPEKNPGTWSDAIYKGGKLHEFDIELSQALVMPSMEEIVEEVERIKEGERVEPIDEVAKIFQFDSERFVSKQKRKFEEYGDLKLSPERADFLTDAMSSLIAERIRNGHMVDLEPNLRSELSSFLVKMAALSHAEYLSRGYSGEFPEIARPQAIFEVKLGIMVSSYRNFCANLGRSKAIFEPNVTEGESSLNVTLKEVFEDGNIVSFDTKYNQPFRFENVIYEIQRNDDQTIIRVKDILKGQGRTVTVSESIDAESLKDAFVHPMHAVWSKGFGLGAMEFSDAIES